MTYRDALAKDAPITFEVMLHTWGDSNVNLNDDKTREAFFSIWAMLSYEYADAMMWEADRSAREQASREAEKP